MLTALSVRNIVLIDRLDLVFEAGLSVLTGETGAGKSILLDALTLALGGRGDQSLVRKGAETGQISAVISLPVEHSVRKLLRNEEGFCLDIEDGEDIILRRTQYRDGRTKAFVNDQAVSAQLLKQIGRELVEIHGQHDERALVDVNSHRALLDGFARNHRLLGQVSSAYSSWFALSGAVDDLENKQKKASEDEAFARHSVEELLSLAGSVGEETQLSDRRHSLMALEKSAGEIRDADEILTGPSAPAATLTTLLRRLQRKVEGGSQIFQPLIERIDASLVALDGTFEALEDVKRAMDFDPNELNETEERLFALRALARKHHVGCDDLGAVLAKYEADLASLVSGNDELSKLRDDLDISLKHYKSVANKLSDCRLKAAKQIENAMGLELPDLKLGAARFVVNRQVDDARMSEHGFDQISFYVQTNPGTQAGPMLKVASGGELSRFLLALKVILAERASAPVLIFDEIDTGVGGAVADAMGRRLERLAKSVQVLTVTHAPQVAARAHQHLLIEKLLSGDGKTVCTHVRRLDSEAKGEEIARMLAGAEVSDEARAAARRLISEVG